MGRIIPISTPRVDLPYDRLAEFCTRWNVMRLSLFGSALRNDFAAESDYDFLVEFFPESLPTLWEQISMEEELAQMLHRRVDLVDRVAVEKSRNWLRRREILTTAKEVYVAR